MSTRTSWPRMSDPTFRTLTILATGNVKRRDCDNALAARIQQLIWDGWVKIHTKGLHGDLSLTEDGKAWLKQGEITRQARAVQASAAARQKAQYVRPKAPAAPTGDDK